MENLCRLVESWANGLEYLYCTTFHRLTFNIFYRYFYNNTNRTFCLLTGKLLQTFAKHLTQQALYLLKKMKSPFKRKKFETVEKIIENGFMMDYHSRQENGARQQRFLNIIPRGIIKIGLQSNKFPTIISIPLPRKKCWEWKWTQQVLA